MCRILRYNAQVLWPGKNHIKNPMLKCWCRLHYIGGKYGNCNSIECIRILKLYTTLKQSSWNGWMICKNCE